MRTPGPLAQHRSLDSNWFSNDLARAQVPQGWKSDQRHAEAVVRQLVFHGATLCNGKPTAAPDASFEPLASSLS